MTTTADKIVTYDSAEAAQRETLTGWVSRNGRFYGDDEDQARYDGCTHRPCQTCGELTVKNYVRCDKCSAARAKEHYLAMPEEAWDGSTMLYSNAFDQYFHTAADIADFLDSEEIHGPVDLMLVICRPVHPRPIDGDDHYIDSLPEDMTLGDVAPKLAEAIRNVNRVIHETPEVLCWMPGTARTTIDIEFRQAPTA